MLKKFNLDSVYAGNEEVNGEHFMVEDVDDGPGAFRACLDVGLSRTSTGANVFGAMKGAADGGIEIPHSEKRFPGYDAEEKVRKTQCPYRVLYMLYILYGTKSPLQNTISTI